MQNVLASQIEFEGPTCFYCYICLWLWLATCGVAISNPGGIYSFQQCRNQLNIVNIIIYCEHGLIYVCLSRQKDRFLYVWG